MQPEVDCAVAAAITGEALSQQVSEDKPAHVGINLSVIEMDEQMPARAALTGGK